MFLLIAFAIVFGVLFYFDKKERNEESNRVSSYFTLFVDGKILSSEERQCVEFIKSCFIKKQLFYSSDSHYAARGLSFCRRGSTIWERGYFIIHSDNTISVNDHELSPDHILMKNINLVKQLTNFIHQENVKHKDILKLNEKFKNDQKLNKQFLSDSLKKENEKIKAMMKNL